MISLKLTFIFLLITLLSLIAGSSLLIFKSGITFNVIRGPLAQQIMKWVFILMPIILIATMTIGRNFYSDLNSFFYIISATWLPVLIYLSLGSILLWLIKFLAASFGFVGNSAINMFPLALGATIISFGAIIFGIINAGMPRIVTHEINSPELSKNWAGKNIVLISDTHLGVVRSEKFMQKVVKKINETRPDLVLIAGDIIDGPTFDYKKGLSPLRNIQSTFGTIYTPGNHESYNPDPEIFYPIVKDLTTTLIDSKTEINGTDIIGIDFGNESFENTKARLEKSGFDGKIPSIAILHDPKNINALLDAGVSLVVSGHTHCGQFWPMTLVVKSIYGKYTHGVVENNLGGVSVTTCGVGTAMSPLRIGTNPEIVVLHIK